MTLSIADFIDTTAYYSYQCATCRARYVVNVQPMQGNGGAQPPAYGPRPMPKGADEARAMALNCCHDDPEPEDGQNVYWAATHRPGAIAHLHLGQNVLAPAEPPEERREYREFIATFVEPGKSESWVHYIAGPKDISYSEGRTNTFECYGFRLDFVPDETHEGRRREWLKLLAHLRLGVRVGERALGEFTFVGARCVDCEHSGWLDRIGPRSENSLEDRPDDSPMFHAYARLTPGDDRDSHLPESGANPMLDHGGFLVDERVSFRVQLRYDSADPLPIAFLRIVALGHEITEML